MRSDGENTQAARELIARCLEGDAASARAFQERYGELVYGYPMRVFRTPPEEAGDFYVFAFDGGRIFRRLRTFEGRAPLRAYLLGFVLDDLVLEWKRSERSIETVSIDEVREMPAKNTNEPDDPPTATTDGPPLDEILGDLEPSKRVVFKLLHAEDCELDAADVRHIAEVSSKSVPTVLAAVDRLRANIRDREAAAREIEDNAESVQAWIQLYERRLACVADELGDVPPRSTKAEKLRNEKAELERKLVKRRRQRSRLVDQVQRRKTTAPYKEIASVLATTVGNVGSQIARLREQLAGSLRRSRVEDDPGKDGSANGVHSPSL